MSSAYKFATLLNAVTANGASAAVETSEFRNYCFEITGSAITTGATVAIEAQLGPASGWVQIDNRSVTANGVTLVQALGLQTNAVRANIVARTDGTFTINFSAQT